MRTNPDKTSLIEAGKGRQAKSLPALSLSGSSQISAELT
jgi:hypothetical protein